MTKILITGDFCPNARVVDLLNEANYEKIFNDLIPLFNKSDYSIVNLECPVLIEEGKGIEKGGPSLKAKPIVIKVLKEVGVKMVTLANNHFYDFGNQGVVDTINKCKEYGVDIVGGGKNIKEAQKTFYKKINGKLFAFVNFCESEFSIATEINGGSSPLDPIQNYHQIIDAKSKADFVIVITHGGHENYQLPSPRMKKTFRFFVDAGASAVINHHTHCFSGYEIYKEAPIFYSLGNFCFDWKNKRNSIWNEGYLVSLIIKGENLSFEKHPIIQGDINPGVSLMNECEVLSFDKRIDELNRIIKCDNLLEIEYKKYIEKEERFVMTLFEPYSNRYLSALRNRNLLPSFLNRKKKIQMLNFILCESHRDKVIRSFKKNLNI